MLLILFGPVNEGSSRVGVPLLADSQDLLNDMEIKQKDADTP